METLQSISEVIENSICSDETTFQAFKQRVTEGSLTRDENPQSHFCAFFLPYNPQTKQVFIVHHKKSGLWLSSGGHVDQGETLFQAVNREIEEELGVKKFFSETPKPFLLTITPIENETQPCKRHFDVWYLMPTDGSNFNIDPKEFLATKWMSVEEARKIITDSANLQALDRLG